MGNLGGNQGAGQSDSSSDLSLDIREDTEEDSSSLEDDLTLEAGSARGVQLEPGLLEQLRVRPRGGNCYHQMLQLYWLVLRCRQVDK